MQVERAATGAIHETGGHPHLVPSPALTPPYRETVSGFSRYSNSLRALPPLERAKIDAIAHRVVASLRHGTRPIRNIEIVGHADLDTPRRPTVEQRMSYERALRVRSVLAAAIERISRDQPGTLPPLPPYSTRVQWDWYGVGAHYLVVPAPRTEADRARNRRVEIILTTLPGHEFTLAYSIPAAGESTPIEMWKAKIEHEIRQFCSRIGTQDIDRQNCAAAVNAAAAILGASAPKTLKCNLVSWGDFANSKPYHAPLIPPASLQCCAFNAPCDKEPYKSTCGHCAGGTGPYLIVEYNPALATAVENVRRALDRGCLAVAGVLSGICDDEPDGGCAQGKRADKVWKECPEHWLLIIGYADDPSGHGNYTFVFWDSARMSPIHTCGHEFGLLFYNRSENRLSTAPALGAYMNVDKDGYHPWPYPMPQQSGEHWFTQKRYQVLQLGVSLPYREPKFGS